MLFSPRSKKRLRLLVSSMPHEWFIKERVDLPGEAQDGSDQCEEVEASDDED